MEDYFDAEIKDMKCIKCGKKMLKLVCSVADHSMHAYCDSCQKEVTMP